MIFITKISLVDPYRREALRAEARAQREGKGPAPKYFDLDLSLCNGIPYGLMVMSSTKPGGHNISQRR